MRLETDVANMCGPPVNLLLHIPTKVGVEQVSKNNGENRRQHTCSMHAMEMSPSMPAGHATRLLPQAMELTTEHGARHPESDQNQVHFVRISVVWKVEWPRWVGQGGS